MVPGEWVHQGSKGQELEVRKVRDHIVNSTAEAETVNWKRVKTIHSPSPLPLMYFLQPDWTSVPPHTAPLMETKCSKAWTYRGHFSFKLLQIPDIEIPDLKLQNMFFLSRNLTNYYNLISPSSFVFMFSHRKFSGKSNVWVHGRTIHGPILKMETFRCFLTSSDKLCFGSLFKTAWKLSSVLNCC